MRVGDPNSAGGVILQGDSSVLVNGRAIAFINSPVSSHPPCGRQGGQAHCSARTSGTGSPNIMVNGKPVLLADSTDTCGHKRSSGSNNVSAG